MPEFKGEKKTFCSWQKLFGDTSISMKLYEHMQWPCIMLKSDDKLSFYFFKQTLGRRRASLVHLYLYDHDDPGIPLAS